MARITLGFDGFGWEAVADITERHGLGVGELVAAGCRRYLSAVSRNGAPPAFARVRRQGVWRDVTVDLEPFELEAVADAATRYQVEREVLMRHVVLTLLADIESGRVRAEVAAGAHVSANAAD